MEEENLDQPDEIPDDDNEINEDEEDVIFLNESDDDGSNQRSAKKRKRSSPITTSSPNKKLNITQDDDGSICPICLDSWEMSGDHRLTSLKCGHLFGHSCIKRWISECLPGNKCCPNCKTKSAVRDFRFIYANKIVVIDKTEEMRLKTVLLDEERKFRCLQDKYATTLTELELSNLLCRKLEQKLGESSSSTQSSIRSNRTYKLFMEKNIDICQEAGCRVILYAPKEKLLIVSQKATRSLFPGFGIRIIDPTSFAPSSSFLNTAVKCIRDMSLDADEQLLVTASQDRGTKLFDLHNKSVVSTFNPCDKILWSSAFDVDRSKYVYFGTSTGSTFFYDIRNPGNFVDEFITEGDGSPVINICPISRNSECPFGGVLVCKLQSIWFFEYEATQEVTPIRLVIDGPFTYMSYDHESNFVLISTRPNSKHLTTRHLIGKLKKINNLVTFIVENCYNGSKTAKVMVRSSQMRVEDDTVVAAYLEDRKSLTTWSLKTQNKMQSLPVVDTIYDSCAIYSGSNLYLGAVTDTKCRIYKVTSNQS